MEMDAALVRGNGSLEYTSGTSYNLSSRGSPPVELDHCRSSTFDPSPGASIKKKKNKKKKKVEVPNLEIVKKNEPSVFHCYIFKSRLQEYCQKAGLTSPVYNTTKEGPSHEPVFISSVTVGDVTYKSLPGFSNRKASEQSAAEIALIDIVKSSDQFGTSQPLHGAGLCKNLLQEYALKMNYAVPVYECHKDHKQSRPPMHYCTVQIGGIKYIGASASSKKEAEFKAARVALLAIQSVSSPPSEDPSTDSVYTVTPQKRKASDLGINTQETAAAIKPKKRCYMKHPSKKWAKRRWNSSKARQPSEGKTHVPNEVAPVERDAPVVRDTTGGGGSNANTDNPNL